MFNSFFNRTFYGLMRGKKWWSRAGHMTICGMCIACWVPKATRTHTEYVTLIASPRQYGYANAPQCYFIRTWTVVLKAGTGNGINME